jgi:uncharacterized membrane protein HdeD (DUF308 family)
MNHKTKILGAILVALGTLQPLIPTLSGDLTPTQMAIATLVVGLLVTILGSIKKATGGFLWSNKTTLSGLLMIIFSAVQGFMAQIEPLLSPPGFRVFTVCVGVGVAILGFLNSSEETPE